ncbi:isoamyl acetate-hydrolyzing esterase 1 homolog [Ptychodera flava]|uniref:isoamyl acetate-hydrolyzing esterase 1 homolog n=1 Tax=Ptychodera flava TaxID=63121 RepID=UPI00396A794E
MPCCKTCTTALYITAPARCSPNGMKYLLPVRLLLLTSCLYRRLTSASTMAAMWPKVILFRDSITQYSFKDGGWGAVLADKLQRRCDVLNRGISGYNTKFGSIILPKIITKETASNVAMVTIFFGANDASLPEINPQQHVPVIKYKHYLQSMIDYLKAIEINEERIILIGPPPVDEKAWEVECIKKGSTLNRKLAVTGEYSKACCEVADTNNINCIDLWTSMQKVQNWSEFLADGLHLSKKGAAFLEETLTPIVLKKLEYVGLQFPYWADIDRDDPAKTIEAYNPYCPSQ